MEHYINYGWQCPVCLRVYSPNTSSCAYCNRHCRDVTKEEKPTVANDSSAPTIDEKYSEIFKSIDKFLREPAFESELWGKPL